MNSSNTLTIFIHVDNQSVIKIAKKDSSYSRMEHIDSKFHMVRKLLWRESSPLSSYPTKQILADLLSKPFSRILMQTFRSSIEISENKGSVKT